MKMGLKRAILTVFQSQGPHFLLTDCLKVGIL